MDGDVQGKFPSEFVFRIDEAPPEDVMVMGPPEDEASMALGGLVMVPKDHPRDISFEDYRATVPTSEAGEPDPESGEYTRTDSVCTADQSRCEVRTYACHPESCEVALEQEVPVSEMWRSTGALRYADGKVLTAAEDCNEETCKQTMWSCKLNPYVSRVIGKGTFDECTLTHREGQLPAFGRINTSFALDLFVAFTTKPLEQEGIHLEPGYNVIRVVPPVSNKAWAKQTVCEIDAENTVFNDASFDESKEAELDAELEKLQAKCQKTPHWERLTDPESVKLHIQLGAPSSMF
jgi:hypothetical protein